MSWIRFFEFVQGLGLLGLAVGAWRYFDERSRDLAWRKTAFLAELASQFEDDEKYQLARDLIDFAPARMAVILSMESNRLTAQDRSTLNSIDAYFNFFDRLHTFVYMTRTLTLADTMIFSGYLDVFENEEIRALVEKRGYPDSGLLYDAWGAWLKRYSSSGRLEFDLKRIDEGKGPARGAFWAWALVRGRFKAGRDARKAKRDARKV